MIELGRYDAVQNQEDLLAYWPSPKAGSPEVVYDVDEEYHQLYQRALAATQMTERAMRRQRHYLIPQTLRRLVNVSGEAAEIGCFRGLSAYVACSTLQSLGRTIPFHIFDSFEGLSKQSQIDRSPLRPSSKRGGNDFVCSEEETRENLKEFSFVKFYKGWIPNRFPEVASVSFSYVHIDVDLYEPTLASIGFFWPRMNAGGVLILDDYGTLYFPGARKALDEYFSSRSDVSIVETTSGSAAAIKLRMA
jgi:hypothetical protein